MTPGRPTTVGFYGPGHASKAVTRHLIEFWYFADVSVVLPSNPDHPMDPEVLEVIKEILGPYVLWETDVVDELKSARADGDDTELVVAWDQSVDDDTKAMVAQARAEKIPVRNLCRAMYPLTEDGEENPPDSAESHAEATAPVWSGMGTLPPAEPAGDFTEPQEVTVTVSLATARQMVKVFRASEFAAMAEVFEEQLGMKHHPGTTVHHQSNSQKEENEVTTSPKTRAWVSDGNGSWKLRGRGRPRADQEVRHLTDEQAREEGLINE